MFVYGKTAGVAMGYSLQQSDAVCGRSSNFYHYRFGTVVSIGPDLNKERFDNQSCTIITNRFVVLGPRLKSEPCRRVDGCAGSTRVMVGYSQVPVELPSSRS